MQEHALQNFVPLTAVRMTMTTTVGMAVIVGVTVWAILPVGMPVMATAVVEGKNTNQVDDEAEDGDQKQAIMLHFGRFSESLKER